MMKNEVTEMNTQLYWDDQDPSNQGWWLRWYEDGTEQGCSVDGAEDDPFIDLIASVENEIDGDFSSEIRFFRGGRESGRIVVVGGVVTDWRCW